MHVRTERLGYERTLAALLGMVGSEVEVSVTPLGADWTGTVASMTGTLMHGRRRRLTLGVVPEDPDNEVVFFSLNSAGATGFAVSKRLFGGATVERDAEGVTVRMVVGPNEISVVAAASR